VAQKHRILIVDDSREIVAGLKNFFEPAYEVLTAHNGFEGMQFFEQYEYGIDLVITDLMMPELNGVGVISNLKKKYPGVPIIAITAYRADVEDSGRKIEADLVLEKPFHIDDLEKIVVKLLSNRGPSSFFG